MDPWVCRFHSVRLGKVLCEIYILVCGYDDDSAIKNDYDYICDFQYLERMFNVPVE